VYSGDGLKTWFSECEKRSEGKDRKEMNTDHLLRELESFGKATALRNGDKPAVALDLLVQ
jgi:hypothetical protein